MSHAICFRHKFDFRKSDWPSAGTAKLSLEIGLPSAKVWLNGNSLDFALPKNKKTEVEVPLDHFNQGTNVVAVRLATATSDQDAGPAKPGKPKVEKPLTVKYSADLSRRDGDIELTKDELERLALFKSLTKWPKKIEQFPGSIILRRFRRGDVVCTQGEPGHSAFYILTRDDLASIPDKVGSAANAPDSDIPPASAHIIQDTNRKSSSRLGVRSFLRRSTLSASQLNTRSSIPNDGPTDIDQDTKRSPFQPGDVFGEMSCLNRAPRSATVIIEREWYMLEFLQNVFNEFNTDDGYRERMHAIYRERVLASHLRNLEFLADLSNDQIQQIVDSADLVQIPAGEVICNEGEPSDAVHIIRKGLVQVVKGLTGPDMSIDQQDVIDWNLLGTRLSTPASADDGSEASKKPSTTIQMVLWDNLDSDTQMAIERIAHGESDDQYRDRAIIGLNKLIHNRDIVSARSIKKRVDELLGTYPVFSTFSEDRRKWTGLQTCLAMRLLVQSVLGAALERSEVTPSSFRILSYIGRGDIIGEIGVLSNSTRTATCVAYDHPFDAEEGITRQPGEVELVSIPASVFHDLLKDDPRLRQMVQNVIDQRKESERATLDEPPYRPSAVMLSDEYQKRGFVQGQKLMLIDLDSCTRCGDCVRACINTHDDGYSRLFLDGPTFDRFLVPSACRQCKDPACMIGCPVGSIQRGDDGQIVIRDWCIGCKMCYKQCPYDSIQMHGTGVVLNDTQWSFAWEDTLTGASWIETKYNDRAWSPYQSPILYDLDLMAGRVDEWDDGSVDLKEGSKVLSLSLEIPREAPMPLGMESSSQPIRLQVQPEIAVVCDQCSSLPGDTPACVHQCPHEAALRFNAVTDFPQLH